MHTWIYYELSFCLLSQTHFGKKFIYLFIIFYYYFKWLFRKEVFFFYKQN